MAESRSETSSATFRELICQLSRQLPSNHPLSMTPIKPTTFFETWLTKNPLKGVGFDTAAAFSSSLEPSPHERAYQILAFIIQSLEYITDLVTKTRITRQTYLAVKQMMLMSIYPAMATRAQQSWKNPFATLTSFTETDNSPLVDLGAAPGEQFECMEFVAWFGERKDKGEVGTAIDIACKFLENDTVLYRMTRRREEKLRL
ncbi:hypothetical protein SVAN01_08143 [Stagonosporopsis vannaccii]|nr:hypothetical protein SVAN01_08143 [Stagonosporopsis vannaccii]